MSFSFSPLPLTKAEEILHDLSPLLLIHKNGEIQRLVGEEVVPPANSAGVRSKDVQISPETGLSVRLYVPEIIINCPQQKLPLIIYFHGGGFIIGSSSSKIFHVFLNNLVVDANALVVSVNYRLAPEHQYPVPYDDSWAALLWVVSHWAHNGDEPWLNDYANFERLFLMGDSAGANISHQMGKRVGLKKDPTHFGDRVKLVGIVLIHPYFWGETPIGGELVADMDQRNFLEKVWRLVNPFTSGLNDPLINPGMDPDLWKLGCKRVLVFVAEKDLLRDRGWYYYEVLGQSGWNGKVEIIEAKGEGHVFHFYKPSCENAITMLKTLTSFINENK